MHQIEHNKKINFILLKKNLFVKRTIVSPLDLIKTPKLCGLKLHLTGRLKGVKRARKIQVMKGMVQAQTFSFPVQVNFKSVQTK